MSDFVETDTKWGSRKAIKYKKDGGLSLYGRYGIIWHYGGDIYSAGITAPKIGNKVSKRYGLKGGCKDGDEIIIRFPKSDLNEMIRTLKIPKSPATQIRYAENFPNGLEEDSE